MYLALFFLYPLLSASFLATLLWLFLLTPEAGSSLLNELSLFEIWLAMLSLYGVATCTLVAPAILLLSFIGTVTEPAFVLVSLFASLATGYFLMPEFHNDFLIFLALISVCGSIGAFLSARRSLPQN